MFVMGVTCGRAAGGGELLPWVAAHADAAARVRLMTAAAAAGRRHRENTYDAR
jgi:hypothetical protein